MATKEMSIKLMIDTQSNKVIFAEASKDFVDFLIFLLSLPIGTAIKLLSSETPVGSFGNIYTSVANLSETYVQPNIKKTLLLNPIVLSSVENIPLSISRSSIISSGKLYNCGEPCCKSGVTNIPNGAYCPGCSSKMNSPIKFVVASDKLTNVAPRINDNDDSEGYVKQEKSYMICDDLSVTLISTMSILSTMKKFNVSTLEVMKVKIGNEEALELLKTTFKSTTVLTDVFMKKKKKEEEPGKSKERPAKKIKTAKNLNKPARPAASSAFSVFMEEFRKIYKEDHPNNKTVSAAAKAGGQMWLKMSKAEMAPYLAEYEKRVTDYEKAIKVYNKKLADGAGDEEDESNKSRSGIKDDDDEDEDEDDD